jgi:hypothetical protein
VPSFPAAHVACNKNVAEASLYNQAAAAFLLACAKALLAAKQTDITAYLVQDVR